MKYRITTEHEVIASSQEEAFELLARYELDIVYREVQKWHEEKGHKDCVIRTVDVDIKELEA